MKNEKDLEDKYLILQMNMYFRKKLSTALKSFVKEWGLKGLGKISLVDYMSIFDDVVDEIREEEIKRILE